MNTRDQSNGRWIISAWWYEMTLLQQNHLINSKILLKFGRAWLKSTNCELTLLLLPDQLMVTKLLPLKNKKNNSYDNILINIIYCNSRNGTS